MVAGRGSSCLRICHDTLTLTHTHITPTHPCLRCPDPAAQVIAGASPLSSTFPTSPPPHKPRLSGSPNRKPNTPPAVQLPRPPIVPVCSAHPLFFFPQRSRTPVFLFLFFLLFFFFLFR